MSVASSTAAVPATFAPAHAPPAPAVLLRKVGSATASVPHPTTISPEVASNARSNDQVVIQVAVVAHAAGAPTRERFAESAAAGSPTQPPAPLFAVASQKFADKSHKLSAHARPMSLLPVLGSS